MTSPKVLDISTFLNFDSQNLLSHGASAPLPSCMTGKDWVWSFVTGAGADVLVRAGSSGGCYFPKRAGGWKLCQTFTATQGNLFSSAQCLQGFRWLTLGSAKPPPKAKNQNLHQNLCSVASGLVFYSVKHFPIEIMVREAWTEPRRFYSIPRSRIQDNSTPRHIGRDSCQEYKFLCFPTHKVHWHQEIIFTQCSGFFNYDTHFIYGRTYMEITPITLHHQITLLPENHRTSSSLVVCLQNKNNLFLTRKCSLSSIS